MEIARANSRSTTSQLGKPVTGVPNTHVALDETDRRIIAILQVDGRRPFSVIAKELGVSEGTVRTRMKRLTEASLLQVVGIADPLRLGFGTMAMVGIRVQPGRTAEVSAALARLPETSYVAATTGRFDVFAEIVCRDTPAFSEVISSRLGSIDGIQSIESFVLLEIYKMAYGWGVNEVTWPHVASA